MFLVSLWEMKRNSGRQNGKSSILYIVMYTFLYLPTEMFVQYVGFHYVYLLVFYPNLVDSFSLAIVLNLVDTLYKKIAILYFSEQHQVIRSPLEALSL